MTLVSFRQFEPIAEGTYLFLLKSCKPQENKSTGDTFLIWELEIQDDDPNFQGKSVNFLMGLKFGEKSMAYKFFRAAGIQELDQDVDFDPNAFIGQQVYGEVIIETPAGKSPLNKFKTFWSVEEFQKQIARHAKIITPAINRTPEPQVEAAVNSPVSVVSPGGTPNVAGKAGITVTTSGGDSGVSKPSVTNVKRITITPNSNAALNFPKE